MIVSYFYLIRCDLADLSNVALVILESCVAAVASGLVGICPTSADRLQAQLLILLIHTYLSLLMIPWRWRRSRNICRTLSETLQKVQDGMETCQGSSFNYRTTNAL